MNQYKKDFPIFNQRFNGNNLVYLDSAATSQKPQVVIDAVREFYEKYNSNIHRGIYHLAEKATGKVEEVREKVAKFINAQSVSEIVFTHGTTESINILAASYGKRFSPSKGVLLSEMEHHSNFVPWQHYALMRNAPVNYLAISAQGKLNGSIVDQDEVDVTDTTNRYSVISVAHVSNVLGTVNNVTEIFKKDSRVNDLPIVVLDAAQSVPHFKIDVQKLGADFIAFSGHKMLSPSGVGVLWGKQKLLNALDPLLFGSQMINEVTLSKTSFQKSPQLLEPGTLPLEGIVGLGAAVDYLTQIGMDTIHAHERELTAYAVEVLSKISGITIYGPSDADARGGIISFTLEGIHPHDLAQILGEKNICVRAGHHCAMPLHKKLGIQATTRISFHIYNDESDVDALVRGIWDAKKLFSI